jgi:hypothetical protein
VAQAADFFEGETVHEAAPNQSLNLTGAALRFRATCSRCSGLGKLALPFGGKESIA